MIDTNSTMTNRINKTSICSILFLDIIDYSKKSDEDQIEIKKQFNDLINHALEGMVKDDRIILDTGDGIAIAYMASPEDLMFAALTIRDSIIKSNMDSQNPLLVRFGINLGPVRIVSDINGRPNIIGDGINVAQRIMSFSEPNQILVSRSYYEVTSRLTLEFSEMFAYSGVKQDKHVREHEIYSVRSHTNHVANLGQPEIPQDERRASGQSSVKSKVNWRHTVPSLFIIAALFALIKFSNTPPEPINNIAKSVVAVPEKNSSELPASVKPVKDDLMPNETFESLPFEAVKSTNENMLTTKSKAALQEDNVKVLGDTIIQEKALKTKVAQDELVKAAPVLKEAKKNAKQKPELRAESEMPTDRILSADIAKNPNTITKPAEHSAKMTESTPEKVKEKSGWKTLTEIIKQGQEGKCTQAQVAMGQCR